MDSTLARVGRDVESEFDDESGATAKNDKNIVQNSEEMQNPPPKTAFEEAVLALKKRPTLISDEALARLLGRGECHKVNPKLKI